ncbi:hypothetical protein GCM10025862_36040 [Arsenicicoccus piscis]|uniref:R3H domain-containing protein n=1 Tax=Arsenicicoccus piscis TaxID=673954 RepID=A0ABQ6HSW2_9MICO|nr:hypothetical protein GCM10025862_36040 [Arsenicicoccus piscis]
MSEQHTTEADAGQAGAGEVTTVEVTTEPGVDGLVDAVHSTNGEVNESDLAGQGEHDHGAAAEGEVDGAVDGSLDGAGAGDDDGDGDGDPEGDDDADGVESEEDDDDTADGAAQAKPAGRSARMDLLEREGEVAADFLETLLDIADLDGDLDVDVDGDRASVSLVDSDEGRVPRRLVGPGGKVLDALQELTRLAVQAETGERSRLMLDIAGHRAERRAALVAEARTVIASVKQSGQSQAMDPMTAFERKVVHDEVLAAGLASESEGADPHRHVVVLPGANA